MQSQWRTKAQRFSLLMKPSHNVAHRVWIRIRAVSSEASPPLSRRISALSDAITFAESPNRRLPQRRLYQDHVAKFLFFNIPVYTDALVVSIRFLHAEARHEKDRCHHQAIQVG